MRYPFFGLGLGADSLQATWVFVVLGNTYDIKRGEWRSDANSLLSAQELWFAAFMTILCVLNPPLSSPPWIISATTAN